MNTLKEKILSEIKKGQVTMRPKWHFVLRTTLVAVGIVLAFLFVIYTVSLIIFVLKVKGVWFAPVFGMIAMRSVLFAIPWFLVLLSAVFIIVLELLTRWYGFARRLPLLYGAFGIIVFVLLSSFIVEQSRFHSYLSRRATEGQLPFLGPMYRGFDHAPFDDIHRGRITGLIDDGFIFSTRGGVAIETRFTPETRLPGGVNFGEGDMVVVFGKEEGGTIMAQGVHRIDPDELEGLWGRASSTMERRRFHMRPFPADEWGSSTATENFPEPNIPPLPPFRY